MAYHLEEVTRLARSSPLATQPAAQGELLDLDPATIDTDIPTIETLDSYKGSQQWAIADPNHRACKLGEPCPITGEELCARTMWLAKMYHVNGRCGPHTQSPGHVLCRDLSPEERELYPECSDCGVLVEARVLVLIHFRMLAEIENLGEEDGLGLRDAVEGYSRAYRIVMARHVQGLQEGLPVSECGHGASILQPAQSEQVS
ncbi:hypothetical protein CPLU01_09839 [Colletotrichum plurivorum]|uniref:Uncharacterized protein n=1 Tax=Colletotrichum plurivorum TaxID=2175906 RepID=A0A8H6K6T8_9PEZI|nr:hypothetical protein CPLU01_09839 [Colletotrichum plurivorum]